jgi:methylenetetrahydrofolate reductase (NADPH)
MAVTARSAVAKQGDGGTAPAFSLEATRPSLSEITALAALLPKGTAVYLSAVGAQTFEELLTTAIRLRAAGLEPVPHLAARRVVSRDELLRFLLRARVEAGLKRVLVIGGDVERHGVYPDALALIRDDLLGRAGIETVGIAGYPEGHPRIAAAALAEALRDKIAAAAAAGLDCHIVTQFSFAPDRVVAWLRESRAKGITVPIKVGMAGPTGVPALLRYARRCGVATSLRGVMLGAAAGLAGALSAHVGPDRILAAVEAARGDIGDVAPHYFSFGGVLATARYAMQPRLAQSA